MTGAQWRFCSKTAERSAIATPAEPGAGRDHDRVHASMRPSLAVGRRPRIDLHASNCDALLAALVAFVGGQLRNQHVDRPVPQALFYLVAELSHTPRLMRELFQARATRTER
jgi:hypothetical protein